MKKKRRLFLFIFAFVLIYFLYLTFNPRSSGQILSLPIGSMPQSDVFNPRIPTSSRYEVHYVSSVSGNGTILRIATRADEQFLEIWENDKRIVRFEQGENDKANKCEVYDIDGVASEAGNIVTANENARDLNGHFYNLDKSYKFKHIDGVDLVVSCSSGGYQHLPGPVEKNRGVISLLKQAGDEKINFPIPLFRVIKPWKITVKSPFGETVINNWISIWY